jgi:hypothetical protein
MKLNLSLLMTSKHPRRFQENSSVQEITKTDKILALLIPAHRLLHLWFGMGVQAAEN